MTSNEKDISNKKKDSMKWSAIGGMLSQFLQFIFIIVLARLLSPEDFGLVGIISIIPLISNALIDGGMSSALIRKGCFDNKSASTVFYYNIIISLIIFIIIFVSAGELSKYMNSPAIKSMLEISSFVIILSALEMMQQVKLTLELNFKKQALITLSSILLSGLIGIVLAVLGFGVWSLVFQQLSNALFRVVFSFIFVRWFPLRVFDIEELKKLFGFGNKLLLSNLLDVAFNYVYILLINKNYGINQVGVFTQSKKLSEVPAIMFSTIIRRVNYPIISRLKNKEEDYISEFLNTLHKVSIIIFPLFFFVSYVSPNIVNILLGNKWLDMVDVYKILLISFSIYPVNSLLTNVLQLQGRSDFYLYSKIINKVVIFSFLMISINFGYVYIFYGMLFSSLIEFFVNSYFSNQSSKIRVKEIFILVIPYFLASLLVVKIMSFLKFSYNYDILMIIISFFVFVILYGLVITPVYIYLRKNHAIYK